MKYQTAVSLATVLGMAAASPLGHSHVHGRHARHARHVHGHAKREVPQEHSHDIFLDLVRTALALNNPLNIQDPVFGLLGDAAAAAGAGDVTNLECLHQETADQAFTNSKAAGDVGGMSAALVYAALERNTGQVGLASVECNITATNPEIGAISQHQDPASDNAAGVNKGIVLALAQQLALIGGDPLLALESGTFAPGQIGDPTAAGNTCDTQNDEPGCIFVQNLLVLDATPDEISSAVAGITPTFTGTGAISATDINLNGLAVATVTGAVVTPAGAAGAAAVATAAADDSSAAAAAAPAAAASGCTVITTTVDAASTASVLAALGGSASAAQVTASAAAAASPAAAGDNVQVFTGTLGGPPPPVISSAGSDRPFAVDGSTFLNAAAALGRSCDVQHNACANAANSGSVSGGVSACDAQDTACRAANNVSQKLRRAAAFGSCGTPSIEFSDNLSDRQGSAFIATDQTDFNHGSALNIGVIAGFICQRLGDTCKAGADVQATCTSASAAAVATTQNEAAADVFNSILIGSSGAAAVTQAAAAAAVTTAAASVASAACAAATQVVLTITSCA